LVFLTLPVVTNGFTVENVVLRKEFLERGGDSPFCLVAESAMDVNLNQPAANFLATQLWPSARTASAAVSKYSSQDWEIYEIGCGPGLPALTAAARGARHVLATDVDQFALKLVKKASFLQGLENLDTAKLDLLENGNPIPPADLFIITDVFESTSVAVAAATLTSRVVEGKGKEAYGCFHSRNVCNVTHTLSNSNPELKNMLTWTPMNHGPSQGRLWLCDVDETAVKYS